MSTERDTTNLLDELTRDCAPVGRLWSPSRRLAAWMAVQVAFAACILAGGVRPDLAGRLGSPAYLAEIVLLCVATLLLARAAIAAAIPGDERWNLGRLGSALATAAALFVFTRSPNTLQAISDFVTMGLPCAWHTTLLALLPTGWLLAAIHRGFPLSPRRAGAVAGSCGFIVGFTLMRLLCPADEPLHLVAWHWVPVGLGSGLAAALGAAVTRYRRS